MSELSYVPSKRDECGLNILIPARLLKQSLFFYLLLCLFNDAMLRLLVWKPDLVGNLSKKLSKVGIWAIF